KPVQTVERVEAFFELLPITALEPPSHVLDILRRWGIHTAGAFLALGKDAIAERLGPEALELFDRASTQTIRPLNIVALADTFEEEMEFEVQIETSEALLFVLRRFVEQLVARIALTYRVVAEFELTLGLETGAPYQRTFKVPAPTAHVETLFRMLHTHLENLRTDAPITFLRLVALPAREERQQFHLFESALRDLDHFHETLARLTALLSSERVGTPVKSGRLEVWEMKTPQFDRLQSAAEKTSERLELGVHAGGLCLRRFRSPAPAVVAMHEGQPVVLRCSVFHATRPCCRGPFFREVHCVESMPSHIEWDVEADDGTLFRLSQRRDGWFVEGVYD
ncbi:MAG TPA: hypothetical protein VK846_00055, partial [Candidatus Limnocylindria bacterium]|nr:hypothetical protein [Candidatus Limnocylindria bacterium]